MRCRGSILLATALLAGCAGPTTLSRWSERELRKGNALDAYQLARRALDRDPEHSAARHAMGEAGVLLVGAARSRIVSLAANDTLLAAEEALRLRPLTEEMARYRLQVPVDRSYEALQARLLESAASTEYAFAEASRGSGRLKEAYRHFVAASSFDPTYRDVGHRAKETRDLATSRVAILPFENDTQVPGLSRSISQRILESIRSRAPDLEFTVLVDPGEVDASMTVKDLESLTAEAALRVARGVEADRAVRGRFHALRARNDTWTFERPIFRKRVERDSSGRIHERWVEIPFVGVARERRISVLWEAEVLDVKSGEVLTRMSEPEEIQARVAWTSFRSEGDPSDYCLVPPGREQGTDGRVTQERWRECFGSWSLPDFLRASRRPHAGFAETQGLFRGSTGEHPVFLEELPSEDELARIALEDVWVPVLGALRDLDARD